MKYIKYAVDSRDGYTTEFVDNGDRESVIAAAKEIVAERFGNILGPFEIWDIENDVHIASFGGKV